MIPELLIAHTYHIPQWYASLLKSITKRWYIQQVLVCLAGGIVGK
jgi:hypothetical protein